MPIKVTHPTRACLGIDEIHDMNNRFGLRNPPRRVHAWASLTIADNEVIAQSKQVKRAALGILPPIGKKIQKTSGYRSVAVSLRTS
jgi:hypothetical protein